MQYNHHYHIIIVIIIIIIIICTVISIVFMTLSARTGTCTQDKKDKGCWTCTEGLEQEERKERTGVGRQDKDDRKRRTRQGGQ